MRKRRKVSLVPKKAIVQRSKDGPRLPESVTAARPAVAGQPPAAGTSPQEAKASKKRPRAVQIRRPLQVHEKRQKLQARLKQQRRQAVSRTHLQASLHNAGRSYTGADIHPIAMISWLSSDEPFHADMLRDALAEDLNPLPRPLYAAFAVEMERLVSSLTSTSLTDTNLLANPLIDVPQGFGMQLVCYSKDFGSLIAKAKRMETSIFHMGFSHKHKRDDDNVERKYGFDPCEILKRNAVHFPPGFTSYRSTLVNEVHPILLPENFHGCPAQIYDQLVPGLRLATHLLVHRSTAHFWHTIAFGERKLDEALTITHGRPCFRLESALTYSEEDAERFKTFLTSVAPNVHIHFSLWPLAKQEGLYAGMAIVGDYKRGERQSSRDEERRKCRICLHTDFYTTAARLAKLQSPDPSLILRFNFFVAITICHEIAHLVEMNGSHESARAGREAYWGQSSRRPEMGSAFEEAVFGGKVHPIGARVDCAWGCTVYDNPDTPERGRSRPAHLVDGERREGADGGEQLGLLCDLTKFYTVPMDYMARLQQKETWDAGAFDEDDLDAGKALLIPRNGAQAVSVPVFDMVVWEDEALNPVSDENEGLKTPFRRMQSSGGIEKWEELKAEKPRSKEVSMAGLDLDFGESIGEEGAD
ncbi:MAG: hypothetical protein INR71_00315 [Terriglobus roseus]|nr:hypothetical protein [Terriglobus roseus]